MSQRIRRSLAVCLLTALFLALPAPSQAAGLWDPAAPTVWVARAWSWLEGLGLVPRATASREKSGGGINPDGASGVAETPPGTGGPYQGSGIDPNGGLE